MVQLRLPPSGPPIEGLNNGDILIWDATTREWVIGPNAAAPLVQAAAEIENQASPDGSPGELTLLGPLVLPPLGADQRYVIQAVVSVGWSGDNTFEGQFFLDDNGGGAASIWTQGEWRASNGEDLIFLPYAMQAWTAVGPSAGDITISVWGESANPGVTLFGHVHAWRLEG